MQEEKNHVGRPTNEEVAERKKEKLNKILTPILVVAIVLVGGFIAIMNLSSNKATNLKGVANKVSKNGNLDVSVKNSGVSVNGCNITIPFMFESDTGKEIIIDKVMLQDSKGTQTFWVQQLNKKLAARTKTTQYIKIPVSGFPPGSQNSGKSTVYFKVIWHYSNDSSKLYYKGESYKYREKLTDNTITLCRTDKASISTTTAKATAVTASKSGNHLNISARNSRVNSGNCKITVPIEITNKQSKELIVEYIELKTSTNKVLKRISVNKKFVRNEKYTVSTTWDINTFPTLTENNGSKNVTFGVVYHLVGSSQKYWKTELYNYYGEIKDADVNTCRNIVAKKTTTTTKKTTTTTKKVTATTKATTKAIVLNCPSSAKVNTAFKCTTNQEGVAISIPSKGLASGYTTIFVTNVNDFQKNLKYTEPGYIEVKASKGGKSVTAKVRIYANDRQFKNK